MKVCVNGTFAVEKIPPAVGIKPSRGVLHPLSCWGKQELFIQHNCSLVNCNVWFNIDKELSWQEFYHVPHTYFDLYF